MKFLKVDPVFLEFPSSVFGGRLFFHRRSTLSHSSLDQRGRQTKQKRNQQNEHTQEEEEEEEEEEKEAAAKP